MDRPEQKRSASRARPYTLTGGRTRARVEVPIEAPVEAVLSSGDLDCAPGDIPAVIVRMCDTRPSIAEISAYAGLPIGVTRVLVSDLVDSGHLRVHATLTDRSTVAERRLLIERTLSGLRAL
ncbi:hypothetical protein A5761_10420 [Mycolicibacterium setense]|uniref:Peroxiredoxin n=2 Tax=Mycolicibacterium setense TaxID=431269 RepID=A0ABR4YQB3_9MYCO|nr:hypothetical protein QQ44_27155 [Mycolicibacterium setense]KHO25860.1 hypothetical protein QQ25_00265 [Mycolicibacterium setense]MCV7110457.1 DUF742 domain-containing protein [Mycolicibacterium setense]OBB17265.1 hypothetical protein A5761_10420 [Mycolicibacterium setense]